MVSIYATSWCTDCKRICSWLKHRGIAFDWYDLETDEAVAARVNVLLKGQPMVVPILELPDGSILIDPDESQLTAHFPDAPASVRTVDVAIIGAGPAGLTAAIYLARERHEVLLIDRAGAGGHAATTAHIENYPGFTEPVGGLKLMQTMEQQAVQFGADTIMGTEVTGIIRQEDVLLVETTEGPIQAHAVLLSVGTEYKHLNVPGEQEFSGRGVHYCATCDGPFYRGKEVVVIGGGNSAVQEAISLAAYVEKITIISWEPALTATTLLQEKLRSLGSKVSIIGRQVTKEITHDHGHVTGVQIADRETGEERHIPAAGVFVFIGLEPHTEWLRDTVELDGRGFIVTGPNLETTLAGVFAAGDCRAGATMQVAAAVGEGATAAIMIRHKLEYPA